MTDQPRILSVSRRTDVPAFYTPWFLNRLRAGYCYYPNPLYPKRFHRVDIRPESVAGTVFWTRHAAPLVSHLDELDRFGAPYYFQYTIVGYPAAIDPHSPSLDVASECFRGLSDRLGPHRTIWRYDPLVLTQDLTAEWHRRNFQRILERVGRHTRRVVFSIVDPYLKTQRRLGRQDGSVSYCLEDYVAILRDMVDAARSFGIPETLSCAEPDLGLPGLAPGRCIDGELLEQISQGQLAVPAADFSLEAQPNRPRRIPKRLHRQRPGCLCHLSVDIGVNDTCAFGCKYCYATSNHQRARRATQTHAPEWNCLSCHVAEGASQ